MKRRFIILFAIFISAIAVDQITKEFFSSRDFFLWVFHFHLLKNYALPFGLNFGPVVNTVLISAGVSYFVWYVLSTRFDLGRTTRLGLVFILAGALSNIIDRVAFGFVRDFIDLGLGFAFNLADVFIFIGIVALLGEGLVPIFRKP